MVDLALGTQTAGSVIRPASFCGIIGLKPTFGLLPTAGIKQVAPSLDTVGVYPRNFEVLGLALRALVGHDLEDVDFDPRFALVRTDMWDGADEDCKLVVEQAAAQLGTEIRELPRAFEGLALGLTVIQAFEGSRSLAWERKVHPDLLSQELTEILDDGDAIEVAPYASALRRATNARTTEALETLFGPADAIVTPAAVGEAPEGLSSTGAPRFNRLWTLLGCPALSVPGAVGATGLPVGVQLVARPYQEAQLLRAGRVLAAMLT